MENASKALLIAAAVLIVIVIIGIAMAILGGSGDVSDQADSTGKLLENSATSSVNSLQGQLQGLQNIGM